MTKLTKRQYTPPTPADIGAVPDTRQVTAGTGLTGGGTLSADRSLAVAYGSAAGTSVQGNDARVVADQAAGTASIRTLGTGAQQAAAGTAPAAAVASHVAAGDPHTQYLNTTRGDARYQPVDADLTAIAALAPADGAVMRRIAGAWSSSTIAEVKTALALAKADVGLGNVDNTSDANKPISTAAQAALDAKVSSGAVGAANGVAPLGADSKIAPTYLPSYVDDVIEGANLAAFPAVGESGKIYTAVDSGRIYRWGGSSYVEISASPGSTDAVPEGSSNLYFTTGRASAAAPVQSVAGRGGAVVLGKTDVGLGNVDNTADSAKPVSTAQQAALDGKQPLDTQLTALAALAGGADALPYFTSTSAAAQTTLSTFMRTVLDDADAATARGTLGAAATSDLAGYVPTTRSVTAGTGLSGGGTLAADRSLAVAYGSAAGTAVQGNDARVTADQAAGTASIRTLGTGALQAAAGNDSRLSDARTPTAHQHSGADLTSGTVPAARLPLVASPPVTVTFASSLTVDPTLGNNFKITATGALALAVSTTGALDAQMIVVEVLASGGSRTVTLNGAIFLSTGLSAATTIASTKVGFFGLRYSILAGGWVLLAAPVGL